MGQKNRKRPSLYDFDKPFDLFEEYEKGQPRSRNLLRTASRSIKKWKGGVGLLVFTFLAGLIGYGISQISADRNAPQLVLLELRAVSSNGNPVAGAVISTKGKRLGVSDSFGEWRRYLKVNPSEPIYLKIQKELESDRSLEGYKKIAVEPGNMKAETLTIRSSVELKLRKESLPTAKKIAVNRRAQATPPPTKPMDSGQVSQTDSGHFNKIAIKYVDRPSKYGTIMESHQARVLSKRVVPELKRRVRQDGIQLADVAPLTYTIRYVPLRNNVGFIKGDFTWKDDKGKTQTRSFLRNFSKTIADTSDALLKNIKENVSRKYRFVRQEDSWRLASQSMPYFWAVDQRARFINTANQVFRAKSVESGRLRLLGDPCAGYRKECHLRLMTLAEKPPVATWQKGVLRIKGGFPKHAEIFVSGFQARQKGSQSNDFSFWGHSDHDLNIAVLLNHEIIHRTKGSFRKGRTMTLTLPQKIAQRDI